ncbi:branched-chain amino acid ABC transporter permease [Streptomyces sp. NPDC005708]|uniref:branched-chain amino acid ABC transporter permease n=1 Tax=Streptomyces sp. NPDC005708 TaxID=3154564 RepID=UPI0033C00E0C
MDQLTQQIANGIMAGSIYGLLAMSLALVVGVLDIPQFAFGAHAMLGAYVVTLFDGQSYWLGVVEAIIVMAGVGALVQAAVFDPLRNAESATLFIAAFGLMMVLQGLALVVFGPDNRSVAPPLRGTVHILGALVTMQRVLVIVVTLVVVALLNLFLRRTALGRSIRAAGQSTTGALVVGLSPRRIAFVTMAIGSALAALAGALIAPISDVYPAMSESLIIKAFIIIVLAGMGSLNGALIGGCIVGLTESFGSAWLSLDFKDAYPLVLLVLILMIRPRGMFGKTVRRA